MSDPGGIEAGPRHRGSGAAWKLVAVFAAAIGLRLWIATRPGLGHNGDLLLFQRWIQGLCEHGLTGFYDAESFCDYPPLMLLLFRGLGAFAFALFDEPSAQLLRFAVKSVACLADLAIGALLVLEGRKLLGARAGVVAGALYLLNPVAVYDSAFWGQVDSIYTAFLVGSFILVRRGSWMGAGLLGALSLTAKFQAIAILPLVLFEALRLGRGRGALQMCAGGLIGLAAIAAPFVATGTFSESFGRAYVGVVGQYHDLSRNAYNVWYLLAEPGAPDTTVPGPVLRAAANGSEVIDGDGSWLLRLTWRRISLVLFALAVAAVLSLYARRPGAVARHGAAGLLALCFYLFPTEMHERYAYPAIAFLALWGAAASSRERLYWALTIALLLNLAAVLPPGSLAPQIAAVNLGVFALILAGLGRGLEPSREPSVKRHEELCAERRPRWVLWLQLATVAGVVVVAGVAGAVHWRAARASVPVEDGRTVWLADLSPQSAEQGWKALGRDRSAEGGHLQVGAEVYTRGVGTHAPATLVYRIPPGAAAFEAILGIDRAGGKTSSAVVRLELDGAAVYESPLLRAGSGAVPVRVDVAGGETLAIRVDPTADGRRSDHVDLALARFTIHGSLASGPRPD